MRVVSAISMFDSLSIINQILLIHCSRASICALTFGVFSNRCCFIFGGSFGINRRSWRVLRLQVRQHASHVLKCRLKRPRVSKQLKLFRVPAFTCKIYQNQAKPTPRGQLISKSEIHDGDSTRWTGIEFDPTGSSGSNHHSPHKSPIGFFV